MDPRWAALAIALILAGAAPADEAWVAVLVPSISPLVALVSALAARAALVSLWIALPALALAWIWPRGICRFVCPLGPVADACGRVRRGVGPGRVPASTGRVLLAVIAGAAAVGWPFFLWLDPFIAVNAFARMARHPAGAASIAAGLLVLIPMALSVWRPRSWCGRICPLGALQDILHGVRKTIFIRAVPETAPSGWPPVSRREFLGAGGGAALAAAARAAGSTSELPVRPPGAVSGPRFGALCVRCGNCAAACPSRIIHPDAGRHGVVSFLSPTLRFEGDYCREDCLSCTRVCPSGALTPQPDLAAKRKWTLGLARVDLSTCKLAAGEECTACVTACPYGAIEVLSEGFEVRPVVDPSLCNGCGACEAVCPVAPVRSIRVRGE